MGFWGFGAECNQKAPMETTLSKPEVIIDQKA